MKTLAEEMGRSREAASRAIKRFIDRGILHRGPSVGRPYTYRLDPGTAWRGKSDARERIEKELCERKWKVINGGSKR